MLLCTQVYLQWTCLSVTPGYTSVYEDIFDKYTEDKCVYIKIYFTFHPVYIVTDLILKTSKLLELVICLTLFECLCLSACVLQFN